MHSNRHIYDGCHISTVIAIYKVANSNSNNVWVKRNVNQDFKCGIEEFSTQMFVVKNITTTIANQSIKFLQHRAATLSGATAKSVFNSNMDKAVSEQRWATGHAGVYGRKAKSKRHVLRHFLKIKVEVAEWTDSRRLFRKGTRVNSPSRLCWS